jgi:hypothetical protein
MRRRIFVGIVLSLTEVVGLCSSVATADTIHFAAVGSIANSTDPISFGIPIPNGTPWTLNGYIDSDALDEDQSPTTGDYRGLTGTLAVGSSTFGFNGFAGTALQIFDATSTSHYPYSYDTFLIIGYNSASTPGAPAFGDWVITLSFLHLEAPEGTETLILGDRPENLLGISMAGLTSCLTPSSVCVSGEGSRLGLQLLKPNFASVEILGGIDSLSVQIVPIPAPIWLLGSALGVLGWARRQAATR